MKYLLYLPLADIGLVKIELGQNLKIVETRIIPEAISKIETSTHMTDEVLKILNIVQNYILGRAQPEDILPYIELPSGLRGLVMLATLAIPRGKVASYSQVAELTKTHPRVVGRFMAENKLPLIIPCHRVVQTGGGLGGYTCGIEIKKRILELEGVKVDSSGKVDRKYFVSLDELRERFLRLCARYRELIQEEMTEQ